MLRFYFSQIIGTGTETDVFRPALLDILLASGEPVAWAGDDLRVDVTQAGGFIIAWADVSDAQHALLIADARVTYLPIEDSSGVPLGPNALVGEVDATRRDQIRTRLEARHVPMAGIALTDPIRRVIARIIRRVRIRRALAADDYTELLDTTISQIPAARRNRIRDALQARGYDTSVIVGTDTIREALRKLSVQDIAWNRNGWD